MIQDELDYSEDIVEVRILYNVIKQLDFIHVYRKQDSLVFILIYKECGNNWLAKRRICRMLPKCFYSLSFRLTKEGIINILKSTIKLLDWKYGNERQD